MESEAWALAAKIKMVVLDVDGVLTDGSIIFGPDGEACKAFHARDGLGISLAHEAGLKTAIITGRKSRIVLLRGEELKISDIYQGAKNKMIALRELASKHNLSFGEMAYIGDDLNDLPALKSVGLPCAVADACSEVKAAAKLTASKRGGRGAVREIIEYILQAQGLWAGLLNSYLTDAQQDLGQ